MQQVDLYSGALFITQALGWNQYAAIGILLIFVAIFTVTGILLLSSLSLLHVHVEQKMNEMKTQSRSPFFHIDIKSFKNVVRRKKMT